MAFIQSSTKGVVVIFVALFLLVVLISVRLINNEVRPFNLLIDVMFYFYFLIFRFMRLLCCFVLLFEARNN